MLYPGLPCSYLCFRRDLEHLIPELVRGMPGYKGQHWLNKIHEESKAVMKRSPPECMAKFVGKYCRKVSFVLLSNSSNIELFCSCLLVSQFDIK